MSLDFYSILQLVHSCIMDTHCLPLTHKKASRMCPAQEAGQGRFGELESLGQTLCVFQSLITTAKPFSLLEVSIYITVTGTEKMSVSCPQLEIPLQDSGIQIRCYKGHLYFCLDSIETKLFKQTKATTSLPPVRSKSRSSLIFLYQSETVCLQLTYYEVSKIHRCFAQMWVSTPPTPSLIANSSVH